jgi:hypothetical protein
VEGGGMKREHLDNVRRVLDAADLVDREEGMQAYPRYRVTLYRFALHYGLPLDSVVGAFVALSPNNDYWGNLRSLNTLCEGMAQGEHAADNLTVSTYGACKRRAWSALQGTPFLDFTKGPKTRAFFQNIMDPTDRWPVTVDGHMVGVWFNRRLTMKEAVATRFRYEEVANGVRLVAYERALVANQVQAMCWFAWKRLNNVVYDPQLDLLRGLAGDQWFLDVHPSQVPVYPRKQAA